VSGWIEKRPEFVGARYDRLAPIYGLFEWLYALPLLGVRRKSVEALQLRAGDAVLELGCGSGRNFALIESRIGPAGRIIGVDLSPGMLARAVA
jgi:demethylmenaquinone methyltransferase/2-methoxy-6-polyprenyl-1,4-benzoquinol methylase